MVPDRPLANRRQESARECDDDDDPSMFSTAMMFITTMTMVMYKYSGRVTSWLSQLRHIYLQLLQVTCHIIW